MIFYLYEFCSIVFVAQGIALPFLVVLAGVLSARQNREIEALTKEADAAGGKRVKSDEGLEALLRGLPKLKPLNCVKCGAGVLLEPEDTLCPNCRTLGPLPGDYVAAAALRPRIKRLLKRALAHWRVAQFLTQPVTHWTFFLLIFAEPLVFLPAVLIGGEVFRDQKTWLDRTLEALSARVEQVSGASADTVLMWLVGLPAFSGFFIWMIVFLLLNSLGKSLRRSLPVAPASSKAVHGSETANCQACGGGIAYEAGDFACICSYCHVENLRVQFVRRERTLGEKEEKTAKSVLFAAMKIIEEFVGTFWITALILGIAFVLLIVATAIGRWWHG